MHIHWSAFAEVFVVSFGVAVGLIVLFSMGVGLLATSPARAPLARRLIAWSCFAACALCVAYGLYAVVAR